MAAHPVAELGTRPRTLKAIRPTKSHQFSLSRHSYSAMTRGPTWRYGAHSFLKRTA